MPFLHLSAKIAQKESSFSTSGREAFCAFCCTLCNLPEGEKTVGGNWLYLIASNVSDGDEEVEVEDQEEEDMWFSRRRNRNVVNDLREKEDDFW
mmetsp:Transcript_33284/g.48574  ORF Transcript_33284/g.48574 Transcript_33284/m.48574 type:complete len:94 (+) Transcript_33284:68-349(+)